MLKTLPVKYQEVISLRYFEGKDSKEIVQILDIKEGTLKIAVVKRRGKTSEKVQPVLAFNIIDHKNTIF